jgi:hypothetical protein
VIHLDITHWRAAGVLVQGIGYLPRCFLTVRGRADCSKSIPGKRTRDWVVNRHLEEFAITLLLRSSDVLHYRLRFAAGSDVTLGGIVIAAQPLGNV